MDFPSIVDPPVLIYQLYFRSFKEINVAYLFFGKNCRVLIIKTVSKISGYCLFKLYKHIFEKISQIIFAHVNIFV